MIEPDIETLLRLAKEYEGCGRGLKFFVLFVKEILKENFHCFIDLQPQKTYWISSLENSNLIPSQNEIEILELTEEIKEKINSYGFNFQKGVLNWNSQSSFVSCYYRFLPNNEILMFSLTYEEIKIDQPIVMCLDFSLAYKYFYSERSSEVYYWQNSINFKIPIYIINNQKLNRY